MYETVCVHVCVCVSLCVVYARVCAGAWTYVHLWKCPSLSLCFISLRQGFLLNLELGWKPSSHSNPVPMTDRDGGATMPDFFCECWNLNSGSDPYAASALIHWAFSTAPDFRNLKFSSLISAVIASTLLHVLLQFLWLFLLLISNLIILWSDKLHKVILFFMDW